MNNTINRVVSEPEAGGRQLGERFVFPSTHANFELSPPDILSAMIAELRYLRREKPSSSTHCNKLMFQPLYSSLSQMDVRRVRVIVGKKEDAVILHLSAGEYETSGEALPWEKATGSISAKAACPFL